MSPEDTSNSIITLQSKGYEVNTLSDIPHVRLVSCFKETPEIFSTEYEKEIIVNEKFHSVLEKEYAELGHVEVLLKAIYMAGKTFGLVNISALQDNITAVVDSRKKEATTLLENTYGSKIDDICPFNPHDSSSFYYTDPQTKKRKMLEPHHVFQYKGHCYDIDAVFRYVTEGGQLNMDESYIKRIFNKHNKVDYSGLKLIDSVLKEKVYESQTKTVDLSNNYLTSMEGVKFPSTLKFLTLDNNNLRDDYQLKDCGADILILKMENCGIENLRCDELPSSLKLIDLKNNTKLVKIHSLASLKHLNRLDIRGTSIDHLTYSKFRDDNGHQLRILCDDTVTFRGDKPEWIIVESN